MINPEFLNEMGFAMAEVYAACTDRLLVNLARHFKYLKEDEKPGGAFEYQAQKLAEFGQVNRESAEIIKMLMDGADQALKDCLEVAIIDALEDAEPELKRAALAGLLNGGTVPPAVSPRVTEAFRFYYEQSADKLNLVNTAMLESTGNAYRATVSDITARMRRQQAILNAATGQVATGVESFNNALKLAVDRMVANGITGFVDHGGHQWSPEAYVAMDMRTTFHNVSRRAFWDRNQEYANDLYLVSQHPGARPLCYPWQCRVISRLNNRRWEKDGAGNPVQVWAQNETSFGEPAGLFGINCGHHPELFVPGATMIPELMQNEEQNAKQYAESQKQRGLERELRAARLRLEVEKARGADAQTVKEAREGVRRAGEKLDEFCDETGRKRRREREYAPVKATWPDPKTYGDSPTAVRDALREHFQGGGAQTPAGRALTDGGGSGTIAPSAEAVGDDVREIATIRNEAVFNRWGKVSPSVVLTDERIAHIREGHDKDYVEFGNHIGEAIETPTYILEDSKNIATALFVKRLDASNINVVVRLKIEDVNAEDLRSSVITMYRLGEKTLARLLKKNNVLYKSL